MNPLALYSAIAITVGYAIYVVVRYGWQKSFSDTYYTQRLGWIFQAWCWTLATVIFIAFYKVAPAVLVSSFGFVVVGAAPKIREAWQRPAHFRGAILTMLGGCWVLMQLNLQSGIIATVILATIAFLLLKWKPRNYLFWIESFAFTVIYTFSLLLNQIICS